MMQLQKVCNHPKSIVLTIDRDRAAAKAKHTAAQGSMFIKLPPADSSHLSREAQDREAELRGLCGTELVASCGKLALLDRLLERCKALECYKLLRGAIAHDLLGRIFGQRSVNQIKLQLTAEVLRLRTASGNNDVVPCMAGQFYPDVTKKLLECHTNWVTTASTPASTSTSTAAITTGPSTSAALASSASASSIETASSTEAASSTAVSSSSSEAAPPKKKPKTKHPLTQTLLPFPALIQISEHTEGEPGERLPSPSPSPSASPSPSPSLSLSLSLSL